MNPPAGLQWLGAAGFLLTSFSACGADLPAKPLAGLAGSVFAEREKAQEELLEWARKQKVPPLDEFLKQSRVSPDPEVRERCRAILTQLVADEYLRVGEGFLGVSMQDDVGKPPGERKNIPGVRVVRVEPGSSADRSGVKANDLIIGFPEKFDGGQAALQEEIQGRRPGEKVRLAILRAGRVIQVAVTLGRLPLDTPAFSADGRRLSQDEATLRAQSRYFRRWMARRVVPAG